MPDTNSFISQRSFDRFRELLREQTGLLLDKPKLRRRLRGILRKEMSSHDADSLTELLESYWFSGTYRETMQEFVNECLVTETLFYRYPDQIEVLTEEIFPRILREYEETGPIRVLSAGCSIGAEPYSLVMAYFETCRRLDRSPGDPGLKVVGVDASTTALRQARQGTYPERPVRHAPEGLVERYFEKEGPGEYRISDELREYVSFQFLNILTTTPPVSNDLILCRNVMLYFDEPTRERLIRRLHESAKQDGYILVGPSEDLGTHPEYVQEPSWTDQPVYRVWGTDRRQLRVGMTFDDKEPSPPDERRESLRSKSPGKISTRCPDDSTQIFRLEGVVARNIHPDDFLTQFERSYRSGKQQYVLDLRESKFISNYYLRLLRRPLEDMIDSGSSVRIVAERELYREWGERCYRTPNVEVSDTPPGQEFNPKSKSTTGTEEVHLGETSQNSPDVDRSDRVAEDLPSGEMDRPTQTAPSSSSRKTSFLDGMIEFDRSSNQIRLQGRFDTGNDPEIRNDFESELFSIINQYLDDESREVGELELDLRNVRFFDRDLVPVLNRFHRRAQRASVSLNLEVDEDLRTTLDRWDCDLA